MYHEEVKVYDDQGSGPVVSCLNESESRHCCVNRTLHQPPAGESIDGLYGDEHGLVSSTVYRRLISSLMHAAAAACYGVARRIGELA